jgi:outer membrane receptor protein involved in Fe transport
MLAAASFPLVRRVCAGGAVLAALLGPAQAQVQTLAAEIVSATRLPQPPEQTAESVRVLDRAQLAATPAVTIDGVLRGVPAFSLFRRTDSFSANPTAQGVSLRGLGPSGASRSLVLLDGLPLNDPFGGWVAWTRVPRANLERVEVVPGGGATAWGNAALGGVVQLLTHHANGREGNGSVTYGSNATRTIELTHAEPLGTGMLEFSGRDFTTDGYPLVAPERRGPVDLPAWSRHHWFALGWRQPIAPGINWSTGVQSYAEQRGNGTPYQRNSSRATTATMVLTGTPVGKFGWTVSAYAQDQTFASTFGSINATRTSETPASDQFAVPATALGAQATGRWSMAGGGRTTAGLDTRAVRGETRERYTLVNGVFTRLRVAGGSQQSSGVFTLHEQPLGKGWLATLGGRIDEAADTRGHRRESDLVTGTASRDDRYAERDEHSFNPSGGLVWKPAPGWRLRAHVQRAFRQPTLNELYRPFRAGANVTEANPALAAERALSREIGVEWSARQVPGPTAFAFNAAVFTNDLRDAVGNVTVARGPGNFPLFGPLAAGAVGRQRLNLDRIRTQGLELSARWQPSRETTLTVDALWNDAAVRAAPVAPTLVGKQLAQVPRRSAAASLSTHLPWGILLHGRVRALDRQFEDDENLLRLGAVMTADAGLTRAFGSHLEAFLNVENATAARIETGRSADGVVNVASPRQIWWGLRGRW